ncbi:CHASE domain-containing protein [Cecembia calidifontis]|uniref:CHASE domain-containing protein n=2 Tax=Cecembia calidifontis TaxID=1187080 RepID=A0A4Q7PEL4_9BACT|nr:CHASE domain-containing protein [Cecembia calidifontis]
MIPFESHKIELMEEIKSYKYFGFFYKFPLLSGFLGFLLAFILSQLITLKDYQILKDQEKDEVLSYSSLIEEKINIILQEAYSAATVLTFLYERVDFEKEFDGVGQEVLRKFPLIDAIQWNEEGVIKYVYPLEENKAAIGFDIFNDTVTHRYIEAYWAIEKGEIFFSGPYELKQGGMGIVGRLPIFKEGKFFAFSVVIFRLETFFDMLEYDPVESKYYVQFSKINPVTHVEEFFLPLQEGYEGFKTVKTIKQGNWILTVQLKKSNAVFQMLPPFLSMSFFSILFGIAVYFLAKLPSILEKEVSKKSRALRIIVRRFRMASKATSDAIWEWDLINDKIYTLNPQGGFKKSRKSG